MNRRQGRAIEERFASLSPGVSSFLGDLDPGPFRSRAILDPIDQSEEIFRSVYARVDRCVSVIAEAIGEAGATNDRDA